jgi:hypothetical protein
MSSIRRRRNGQIKKKGRLSHTPKAAKIGFREKRREEKRHGRGEEKEEKDQSLSKKLRMEVWNEGFGSGRALGTKYSLLSEFRQRKGRRHPRIFGIRVSKVGLVELNLLGKGKQYVFHGTLRN